MKIIATFGTGIEGYKKALAAQKEMITRRYLNSPYGTAADLFMCWRCESVYPVIPGLTLRCPVCGVAICTSPGCNCGGCA